MEVVRRSIYRSADFEIDPGLAAIRRGDEVLYLRPKTFQVLLYLLENRHRLVGKEELIESIWGGLAITDDTLVQSIVAIRRVLGDDPRRPQWVKTIPKTGYRFIGPIEEIRPGAEVSLEVTEVTTIETVIEEEVEEAYFTTPALQPPPDLPSYRRYLPAVLAVLAVAVLIFSGIWKWSENRSAVEPSLNPQPGKRSIAVLHFENQSGNADLDWLREGLSDMLITGLSRSRQLMVLSRPQLAVLLDRIGHTGGDVIRLDEGLDIARRSQAEMIVIGSFARLGERIRVDIHCHDGRNGQMQMAESLTVEHPEELLSRIDLLSLKLATQLGGSQAHSAQRPNVGGASTTSLEAYRYYSLALEKAPALDNLDAIALLEKATRLDPEFAMAYARIGSAYAVTWDFAEKSKPYLERAFQLQHRLTEKEKLYIKAWYSIANLDFTSAMRQFREIIAIDPRDIEAYWRLGCLLEGEDQFTEAIEVLKQALAIDPEAKDIYNVLGFLYADLGSHDRAVEMIEHQIALAPSEPNAYNSLGLIYHWAGRYEEAIRAYQKALALEPTFDLAMGHLGNTYFHQGRYQQAINQYRHFIGIAKTQLEKARGWGRIAWVYRSKGELAKAEEAARFELENEPTAVFNSVILALDRGNLAPVDDLMARSSKFSYTSRGARTSLRYITYIRGSISRKRGQTEAALEDFRATLRHRPPIWATDAYEDCLGNAFLELGRFDEAIGEYERVLRLNPRYPLARFHLAQALEKKGESVRAGEEYRKFLEVWKDADPDLPQLTEARRKLG
jgi:tetratricopeptide (TPR) repeat protein/DNA-binding winged helix-turn-helix (wHTH) protein